LTRLPNSDWNPNFASGFVLSTRTRITINGYVQVDKTLTKLLTERSNMIDSYL